MAIPVFFQYPIDEPSWFESFNERGCRILNTASFVISAAKEKFLYNMKNQCERMYAELLAAIRSGKDHSHSHLKWIEDCFQLCFRAYIHLQKMTADYQFANQQEEIWFNKAIEPQFSAQTKYFTLMYTAEMFAPDDLGKRMDYWRYELKKNLEFFDKHEAFYQYYKKGLTNQDSRYFASSSSYIDLLASFIAREKYLGFLQKKIGALSAVQPPNRFFFKPD